MRTGVFRQSRVAVFSILTITACTPSVYDQQVADFNSGVQETAGFVVEQRRLETELRDAERDAWLLRERVTIRLNPDCQDSFSKRDAALAKAGGQSVATADLAGCELQVREPGGEWSDGGLADSDALDDSVRLVLALTGYAQALDTIVNGEGREAFEKSAEELSGAVLSLAGTVEATTEAEVPDAAAFQPLTALFAEGAAIYLESRRYRALKTAVELADPLVAEASLHLSRTMESVNLSNADLARDRLEEASFIFREELDDAAYRRATDSMTAQHAALIALLRANPGAVFTSMGESHAALLRAIDDPRTQLSASIKSVRGFYAMAREARSALAGVLSEEG